MAEAKPDIAALTASKNIIAPGDLVIIWVGPKNVSFVEVTPGVDLNNAYGKYPHADMVGKEFGAKVASANGQGFVYLLYPTPELWTLSLPHRTQILYNPDISLITSMLDLRPGVKIIEAGTGSGSFSHAIARTVAPSGHLYTFEYSEDRFSKAKEEFESHKLEGVTIQHRDVCADGFAMEDAVDAVFLDMPAPWAALEAAKKAFKRNKTGKICCFSPCMEQVLTTCDKLKELRFVEIQMFEVLVRPYDLRTVSVKPFPKWKEGTDRHSIGRDKKAQGGKKRKMDDDLVSSTFTQVAEGYGGVSADGVPEVLTIKPAVEIRGHTSYLTFATLLASEYPGSDEA
ncbi:tRNA (adenine-N(1)-)-methyltransferase catalytic subunit trm61 [Thoreauomyces humboldtii]|nr:tRNA (adenine-N(1)-)-methyltransferase catalytic subunit trm61 [Thoreauomyces humboldtii]